MAKFSHLVVWMNGERVGRWSQTRSGAATFSYDPAWVESKSGRALSLSLPFAPGNAPHRGGVVTNYFENLLPDSEAIRARIRNRFATESVDAFDLLGAVGRDCAGAVQLLPVDEIPSDHRRIEAEPLTEKGVEQVIGSALSGERTLGQADEGLHSDDPYREAATWSGR